MAVPGYESWGGQRGAGFFLREQKKFGWLNFFIALYIYVYVFAQFLGATGGGAILLGGDCPLIMPFIRDFANTAWNVH